MYSTVTKMTALWVLIAMPMMAQGAPTPGEQDLIRDRQDRLLEE